VLISISKIFATTINADYLKDRIKCKQQKENNKHHLNSKIKMKVKQRRALVYYHKGNQINIILKMGNTIVI